MPGLLNASPAQPEYVEGEVIVTLKGSVTLDASRKALGRHSMAMSKHFGALSKKRGRDSGLVRVKGRSTADLIAELKNDPSVETVEPNYVRHVFGSAPNDALFVQMWALSNTGQAVNGLGGTSGDDIKFMGAWSLARPATGDVVTAVIDTGVDYHHPDLAGNIWTNAAETPADSLDNDGNGYVDDIYGWNFAAGTSDPSDSGVHGTHVAGTIAAIGNNQTGVIGVCYRAKIMPLRVSNDGDTMDDAAIIEAIQYTTMMKQRGVNVVAINASFGGPGFDSVMQAAIQAAGDAGIIFCAAAGNDSADNGTTETYPANYHLPNMIVVAATDSRDSLAGFSNYGATNVDLGAPGVNIMSLRPTNSPGRTAYVQLGSTMYAAGSLEYSGTSTGISGPIYDCGLGYLTNFPAAVNGNIALISRGAFFFSDKVANAIAAGARAAIIYNNVSGNFSGTLTTPSNWIPAISISQADGLAIKAALPRGGTVANYPDPAKIYQFLDGTSMATPHVVGAVAFAAMNFPDESVTQRVQRLLSNVDIVPGLQGKVRTGGRLNLQRIVDSDGNGLPDWWEQTYFGKLTGANPNLDTDHDGASDFAEWVAGTDPLDANSNLRVSVQTVPGTNGIVISWPSVVGKTYRLESATNLLTGFNTVVKTNIAAAPPLNLETDAATGLRNSGFYRVQVEQ